MTPLPRLLPAFCRSVVFACILVAAAAAQASELVKDLAAGRPRKVVVYGTSLTAGGPWVTQMQTWLAANYSGTMTLVNSGLSGKNLSLIHI